MTKIQVLGLTRWSYPCGTGGFNRTIDDLERLRADLYAPRRLAHRVCLLEHLLLPCLSAQKDKDFTHLFAMGDQLPQPWRGRVLALLEKVPQIRPVFIPEGGDHDTVCRDILREHLDPDCDVVAQYRLDDDDAIGTAFVAQCRARFPEFQTFFDSAGAFALDFSRGFIFDFSAGGLEHRPVSMRFWAPGLLIYQRANHFVSQMDYNHLRIWHHMPTLVLNDKPIFIRGAHEDNDSDTTHIGRRARGFKFDPNNARRYFRNSFGIDLPGLRAAWAGLQKEHATPDEGQKRRA